MRLSAYRSKYVESSEQVAFMRRCAAYPYGGSTVRDFVYAVPNAGTTGGRRAMLAGMRRKAEGVTPGIPDIECMVASQGFHGLHIEMKRKDGKPSDVSEAQTKMMFRLESCGRKCVVAYGAEQAWTELCKYLGLKP